MFIDYLWCDFFFQGGTYAVYVERLRILRATLAPIRCARRVSRMKISCVLEEPKDFAQRASNLSC